MEYCYLECICETPEHTIRACKDSGSKNDAPQLVVGVQLFQFQNIFKRIWLAIKYILKLEQPYGYWDCTILKPRDVEKFEAFLKDYKAQLDDWERRQKDK